MKKWKGFKYCSRCRTRKSTEEFYKGSNKPDGLQDWCKECYKKYNLERKNIVNNSKKLAETETIKLSSNQIKFKEKIFTDDYISIEIKRITPMMFELNISTPSININTYLSREDMDKLEQLVDKTQKFILEEAWTY